MTTAQQQLAFTKAFGVMPSRTSAKAGYLQQFPNDQAFIDSADFAQGPVNAPKMDPVLADFDSQLQGLATGDPKAILVRLQTNVDRGAQGLTQMTTTSAPLPATTGPQPRRRTGIYGRQGSAGWLFVAPALIILGLFLLAADPDGAVRQLHQVERSGQPVHRLGADGRHRQLHGPVRQGRPGPAGLHDEHPQQPLLRGCSSFHCRRSSRWRWRWSSTSGCSRASRSSGPRSTSRR